MDDNHFLPASYIISIHTLRVEGDIGTASDVGGSGISIHTLRVEGDHFVLWACTSITMISIHTLRVEGDPIFSDL